MSMGSMIALGAGGLALAGGGGGGSGNSDSPQGNSAKTGMDLLKAYANATHGVGVTPPTLVTYKEAGVKALSQLSETTATGDITSNLMTSAIGTKWLSALNSALDLKDSNTLTLAKVQSLADSYYRILSEADNDPSVNVDVYPTVTDATGGASLAGNNDPSTADYANIGATVGNDKSVDLLNDYVGRSDKSAVDTVDKINVIAKAAYNVMLLAKVAAVSGSVPVRLRYRHRSTIW